MIVGLIGYDSIRKHLAACGYYTAEIREKYYLRIADAYIDIKEQRGQYWLENIMKDRFAVSMFGQKRLSREGGIEIVVKELCTRMARDGCQVTCYNRSGHHVSGAEYDNKIEYDGIRQKFVPTIERKGLAAVSSSFFAALYSAFGKYDVVHIHAEGPAFFSWLPKMFRKRVVVTIHGIDWQREKWKSGFGSKFIRQGEKNAVKYADEIIVLSKGVQDYFKDTYGRETHFIPNGVNRPETREAGLITEKFGLTKDSYILFLGRLVPEKGIRYLVKAFKNVKTDKKLVIAGGSSDTDSFMMELKELAKDDDRIIFIGFVQGQLLDELYSNAYIYTLPSDLEGMPLSLLEAMSYGNCCLVSDISECTEVVENKALIFKKSDVDELREKLQDACDHPEKVMEMKAQATDFICKKYNWDEVVNSKGNLIEVGRGDLVGKYVGWTAPTIQKKFSDAKGSVLFIDEAYSLVDDRNGSFGDEAINTIVQEMENHRDDVVVIFAGYPDKMEELLQKNPGLRSRIAYHVPFNDYDTAALCEIAKLIAKQKGLTFTDEACNKLTGLFDAARNESDFGNGRYVRNVIEKAKMAQATRLLTMDFDSIESEDIALISADDIEIPKSSAKTEKKQIGFST